MRGRKDEGGRAGQAVRVVENHWEFQPFNWPEACWGGDLAEDLVASERRGELLKAWGGTTTADRRDWREIVSSGLRDGWYGIRFGAVASVTDQDGALAVTVDEGDATSALRVDWIIDATGLISSVDSNPVLADLIQRYGLPLNEEGRLAVSPDFELEALRNGPGRAFAAGVATLGGPYAPVDSFLGLQYSAFAAARLLSGELAPEGPLRSLGRWWRWATGREP
jgi:hypothetical protein